MILSRTTFLLKTETTRDYPPVDIYETDDSIIFMFDLPGINHEELIIKVCDNQLFIWGTKEQTAARAERYLCMEREAGGFFRVISIPQSIDPAGAKALYSDGVLKVIFPKVKEKVFKIKVKKE